MVGKPTPGLTRLVAALIVATMVTAGVVGLFFQGGLFQAPADPAVHTQLRAGLPHALLAYNVEKAKPAPPSVAIATTLDRTAPVTRYLLDGGLNRDQALRWAALFRETAGSRLMRRGHPLTLYKDPTTGVLRGFRYNLNYHYAVMELSLGDGVTRVWRLPIEYRIRPVSVTFRVHSDFQRAAAAHGVPKKIVRTLEQAFESRHPLNRLSPGSTVKLIYKEKVAHDGTWRLPTGLEAAQFDLADGKTISAFAFSDGTRRTHLYDAQGHALGETLCFPVRFDYISSGFSMHRYHPLLHIYRPHLGVDFATPYGTPVKAVAAGRVMTAGWCGELGRCIKIRHPGDLTSIYGHLSRISAGVHPGVVVHMGEVIGKVGSSGLSTGPHLHFGIEKGDRFVNPLTMHLGANHQISPRMRAMFDKIKQKYELALDKLPALGRGLGPAEAYADEPAPAGIHSARRRPGGRHRWHHRHHYYRFRTARRASVTDFAGGM